jgi:hypothetical protein
MEKIPMKRFVLILMLLLGASARAALACPFCSAQNMTLCEEISTADVAVIAKLVKKAAVPEDITTEVAKSQFEVLHVLRGDEHAKVGAAIGSLFLGEAKSGDQFLITGIDPPDVGWAAPIGLTPAAVNYLLAAMKLPVDGGQRLVFFQDYLEDADETVQRDAYTEFARASFSAMREIKDQMHRDQLLQWIANPKTAASHRRLYLSMLSVCGKEQDADLIESMLTSKERKLGLDAMIGAYVILKGESALGLVEKNFLANKNAEYTETWSAIQALRTLRQEKIISREATLRGMRHILDRSVMADTVIADFARMEDWTLMDRLVEMAKSTDKELMFVRVPVINYLRVCPEEKAKDYLQEMSKFDPRSYQDALTLYPSLAPAEKSTKEPPPSAALAKPLTQTAGKSEDD